MKTPQGNENLKMMKKFITSLLICKLIASQQSQELTLVENILVALQEKIRSSRRQNRALCDIIITAYASTTEEQKFSTGQRAAAAPGPAPPYYSQTSVLDPKAVGNSGGANGQTLDGASSTQSANTVAAASSSSLSAGTAKTQGAAAAAENASQTSAQNYEVQLAAQQQQAQIQPQASIQSQATIQPQFDPQSFNLDYFPPAQVQGTSSSSQDGTTQETASQMTISEQDLNDPDFVKMYKDLSEKFNLKKHGG